MDPLYHVDYSGADGTHEGVKYDFWCDVVSDVRTRVTSGWRASVYRYYPRYRTYLYCTDVNPWNEAEERRQLAMIGKELRNGRNL